MSGFNSRTGFYELTYTKACEWSRCGSSLHEMEFFADRLRKAGFYVESVREAWLAVSGSEYRVRRALRGS